MEEDELTVEDLVQNAASMTDADIERTGKIALSEPELVNRLLSPTGHVTEVNMDLLIPSKSAVEVIEVAMFARKIVVLLKITLPARKRFQIAVLDRRDLLA